MKPYTNYVVKLGDLKEAIRRNPYDPTRDIDGYMRYLKYNTKEAEPERKRGKWIKQSPTTDTEECSECGYNILGEEFETPYCPWCGSYNGG